MSKLSFRARALDASKPMPIYMAEELPDLPDYSAINRAVPQMPSGMEKEEECEHHLQRAICTGLIIPTPEVADMTDAEAYDKIYPIDAKLPRQLIHMQPFAMEQDIPDYDMDSEDERWVNLQAKKMDVDALKFEEMMDRLEKGSGQTVVTLQEAKSLLKEDDDLIIAVYDYWLNKRLKTQHPLILAVKTEHRLGSAANNPYLAFRRRTEKMQTRKNRKNDETSYEKMLKLRRDLSRAVTLLELSKRREKTKRELFHLTIEVFEKRYQCSDFSGQMLAEVSALKVPRPAFAPLFANQFGVNHQSWATKVKEENVVRKEKRQYKKRKHKGAPASHRATSTAVSYNHAAGSNDAPSSEDEAEQLVMATVQSEEDTEPDPAEEPFAFRRKLDCNYLAPLPLDAPGNWPWCSREEGGQADRRYRYCLTSVSAPRRRCVGMARRRVGRGGRVLLDRAATSADDLFTASDFTVVETRPKEEFLSEVDDWLHFRPRTPPPSSSSDEELEMDKFDSLRAIFPPDATLSVEPVPDDPIFSADDLIATEFNLYEFLSTSPSLDYQLGGNYLEENPILERLGHIKSEPDASPEPDDFEPFDESSRGKPGDSTRGKVGYSEFGCSAFTIRPSVSRQVNKNNASNSFTTSGLNSNAPVVNNVINRHKKHCSSSNNSSGINQLATSNYLTSPTVVTNCADHGYSNGGVEVIKKEPSVSGLSAVGTSERIGSSGFSLTNGPGPALPEYPGTSRSRLNVTTTNCCYTPSVTSVVQHRSTTQLRPSGGGVGNFVLTRGVTVKHDTSDEDSSLNTGEPMDVEPTEKPSNQVCVDKKQLVRKNNSLPMEVT